VGTRIKVGAFDAKTRFSELLEDVRNGAEIVITKHEKPVAKLVPIETATKRDLKQLLGEMAELKSEIAATNAPSDNSTYRDLISAGRKW
jgi:prevent-host-death family protein